MNTSTNYQTKLIGYCSISSDAILKKFLQKGPSCLADLKGEYVIIIENNNECYIITSPYGICQYYYVIYENRFFHNNTVIGILQRSRLPWSWNWKALADLTQLDHVLENDTLHSQIQRVPPGSILHFRQGALKISSLTWEEKNPSFPTDPDMALIAFNDATRQWLDDDIAILLSGGFDSRVILSSLLKHGCRPSVLTMGLKSVDATDVIISRQIASNLGLDLTTITLDLEDYLKHGNTIAALTNGTQTAQHWHSYLSIQKARLNSNPIFFTGCNGEFARSYYFDKGIIAQAADIASPLSLLYYWKRTLDLKLIFKEGELNSLQPEFSNEFTKNGQNTRLHRIISLCHNKLLGGFDRFYIEQRERNFFGNIFRLYSEKVSWRAPFLNREWINAAWNLKRYWKLGSNWHRFAIAKNYPQLLDFPEPGKADSMYPKAPLLYWHPARIKYTINDYAKYQEWFQSETVIEFISGNAQLLSELIKTNTVISIAKEHKNKGGRTRTIAFLLTMIFWLMNLKGAYKGGK